MIQEIERVKSWLRWEVWLVAIAIGAVLWFTNQLEGIRTNQAVMNNKLDTLIAWAEKHDEKTVSTNKELNTVFATIFEKLGQRYTENITY